MLRSVTSTDTTLALAYAELSALSALDTVGRRLTRTLPRQARHRDSNVRQLETYQRHTVIPTAGTDLDRLLQDVHRLVSRTAHGQHECINQTVMDYVRDLVRRGEAFDPDTLAAALRAAGCVEAA